MADVAIVASAVHSAPTDYTIPGAQELLPKAVSASMDGTAAASTWFPALQVLDPFGHVMFSAVSGDSVAAGGSADASWFPHVAKASLPTPNTGGLWADYTPTWTSKVGADPVLGNGTLTGIYFQIGAYVVCRTTLTSGTTTTYGGTGATNVWRFSLPVPAANAAISFGMSSNCIRNGATIDFPSWGFQDTTTQMAGWGWSSGTMAFLNNAAPWSWTATDRVLLACLYEAA